MNEKYCVTIEDVYGVPFAALSAPQGYEFTGEFRPALAGELALGMISKGVLNCVGKSEPAEPRLILLALPTVESVYGGQTLEQLKENAKTASCWFYPDLKFEWTGEFRKVENGDYFLSAKEGASVMLNDYLFTGQYRLIMRKCPTIKEIYGKEPRELTPPIGYRFTGEFRNAKAGETVFLKNRYTYTYWCDETGSYPRLILEKLPPTPTIKDFYGTDTPGIPKGWRFKEFRQVTERNVPYLTWSGLNVNNMEAPPNPSHWDGWRIVLEKEVDLSTLTYTEILTVKDVYGDIPQIPLGYKVIGFRPPKAGDVLLNSWDRVETADSDWNSPHLILSPLGPR